MFGGGGEMKNNENEISQIFLGCFYFDMSLQRMTILQRGNSLIKGAGSSSSLLGFEIN